MLCQKQCVDLPQRGNGEPISLVLELQLLQRHNLAGLLVAGPVYDSVCAFLDAIELLIVVDVSAADQLWAWKNRTRRFVVRVEGNARMIVRRSMGLFPLGPL